MFDQTVTLLPTVPLLEFLAFTSTKQLSAQERM